MCYSEKLRSRASERKNCHGNSNEKARFNNAAYGYAHGGNSSVGYLERVLQESASSELVFPCEFPFIPYMPRP